eukprot:SAG22_NODE_1062_length_5759_cov_11.271025_6_plen_261_part_00
MSCGNRSLPAALRTDLPERVAGHQGSLLGVELFLRLFERGPADALLLLGPDEGRQRGVGCGAHLIRVVTGTALQRDAIVGGRAGLGRRAGGGGGGGGGGDGGGGGGDPMPRPPPSRPHNVTSEAGSPEGAVSGGGGGGGGTKPKQAATATTAAASRPTAFGSEMEKLEQLDFVGCLGAVGECLQAERRVLLAAAATHDRAEAEFAAELAFCEAVCDGASRVLSGACMHAGPLVCIIAIARTSKNMASQIPGGARGFQRAP